MAGDNKSKLLRDAEKYVLQGKLAQAITEYQKITKSDPNDVLTLNTIGDLHLRMGKASDARKAFAQVAEHYVRNNFLLKAIAVYKKILSADAENLEVNTTLAVLYARQGLSADARNQYLRVAELHAAAGRSLESVECYEKVVELDPNNSAVQLKLAEIHLAEGAKEKAHSYFAGSARAQAKAGDLKGAVASFRRASELNPVNVEVLRGYLEASIQLKDVSAVLDQLKKTLLMAPENVGVREMLGRAFLAAGDPENAYKVFQTVIEQDESQYHDMLNVSKAFVEAGDPDQAVLCLDLVVPMLISRRDTERGIAAYNLILKSHPRHVLTLTRLAGMYSAINNQTRHIETLEKVATYYLDENSPADALEYLQRVLQMDPENEKYQAMHRKAFTEAFPEKPYQSPVVSEGKPDEVSVDVQVSAGDSGGEPSNPAFVEIDLLLTYGMTEKALEQLHVLATEDPWNIEIRRRMIALYKETRQLGKAADECLILASLYLRDHDESSAEKSLSEARKLAPELVGPSFDLESFAQRQGIVLEKPGNAAVSQGTMAGELDLSGDLSEMFFSDRTGRSTTEEADSGEREFSEISADEYTHGSALVVPMESIEEKLQEVDFYIRLGFYDEARAKLDEIAKDHPNNTELPRRYRQLPAEESAREAAEVSEPDVRDEDAGPFGGQDRPARQEGMKASAAGALVESQTAEMPPEPLNFGMLQEIVGSGREAAAAPASVRDPQPAAVPGIPEQQQVNTMFADLLDEVNSVTDQEIAREDFETHFNLGTAYREMDLTEDAIKEFQKAVKALESGRFPKEIIRCCGMLSTCFLDKGMPRSAIRWCQTGLNIPEISSHEAMALRYDMAVAYVATGDSERALECYGAIFGIDPSYRDVAQKIDHLRGGSERDGS
jgi:tetratricopeptide (TPR) repeat protein